MNYWTNLFKSSRQRVASDSLHRIVAAASDRHAKSAERVSAVVADVLDENARLRDQMHNPVAPH